MRKILFCLAALLATTTLARAGEGVGAANETVVSFEAKVVDLACQLGATCPSDCGGGKRQLGLLTKDGKLRAAVKSATIFAGPVDDLLPFCGKSVTVDGVLVENPKLTLYFVQGIREGSSGDFAATDAFEKRWVAANGPSEEWFRNDPKVKEIIAKDGVLGIKGLVPKPQ